MGRTSMQFGIGLRYCDSRPHETAKVRWAALLGFTTLIDRVGEGTCASGSGEAQKGLLALRDHALVEMQRDDLGRRSRGERFITRDQMRTATMAALADLFGN
jgi:hypothetical protein